MTRPPVNDVGFARLDLDRLRRTGDPEVVLASHKEPGQTALSLLELSRAHPDRAVLATRCDARTREVCRHRLPGALIDEVAQTVVLGPLPGAHGTVVIITAGTSDLPVAREAMVTAQVFGAGTVLLPDLGVAGLHRLLSELDTIAAADAIVAIAGTDGALPGVIAGLVGVPVIAVPTSVGYGASLGGIAALLTMLNACAPGVSVVNIDNGFGAAVCAARIARRPQAPAPPPDAA
jgi:pyridinium-3,5-biscarboxylic acid mononucleotide synthase